MRSFGDAHQMLQLPDLDGWKPGFLRPQRLVLLTEGAMALMLIHGDRSNVRTAASAAKRLVGGIGNVRDWPIAGVRENASNVSFRGEADTPRTKASMVQWNEEPDFSKVAAARERGVRTAIW